MPRKGQRLSKKSRALVTGRPPKYDEASLLKRLTLAPAVTLTRDKDIADYLGMPMATFYYYKSNKDWFYKVVEKCKDNATLQAAEKGLLTLIRGGTTTKRSIKSKCTEDGLVDIEQITTIQEHRPDAKAIDLALKATNPGKYGSNADNAGGKGNIVLNINVGRDNQADNRPNDSDDTQTIDITEDSG